MDKQVILRYDSYSTGRYGSHNCEGVTLQFFDDSDGCFYYAIWNVNLRRKRTTKNHSRASDYPRNKFSVTRRMKFFYFWHFTCGLPTPCKGLTAFNECMGKLKKLQFQAMIQSGKRLDKDTIEVIAPDKTQSNFGKIIEKNGIFCSKQFSKHLIVKHVMNGGGGASLLTVREACR